MTLIKTHRCYEQNRLQSFPTKYYFLHILTWQLRFRLAHFVKHQHTQQFEKKHMHLFHDYRQKECRLYVTNTIFKINHRNKSNYPCWTYIRRYSSRSIILNIAWYRCNNSASFITTEHVLYSILLINTDTITTFREQYILIRQCWLLGHQHQEWIVTCGTTSYQNLI